MGLGRVALFVPKAVYYLVEGAYYGVRYAAKPKNLKALEILSTRLSQPKAATVIARRGLAAIPRIHPENKAIRETAFNVFGKGWADIFRTELVTKEGLKLKGWEKALHMAGNAISLKSWQQLAMYGLSGAGLAASFFTGKDLLPTELNIMGQLNLGYKGADLCRSKVVHGLHAAAGAAMLAGPLMIAAPLLMTAAPVGLAAAGVGLTVGGAVGHAAMYVTRNVGWGFWNPVKYYERWAGIPVLGTLFKAANSYRFYS